MAEEGKSPLCVVPPEEPATAQIGVSRDAPEASSMEDTTKTKLNVDFELAEEGEGCTGVEIDIKEYLKPMSMYGCAYNVMCAVIGGGILGLPHAFAQASGWVGTGLMVFTAILTAYTGILLGKCAEYKGRQLETFGEVGMVSFGPIGKYVALTAQLTNSVCVGILYLILAGDNMNRIVPQVSSSAWASLSVALVLPICFLKTLRELAPAAFIGMVASILVAIVILVETLASPSESIQHKYPNPGYGSEGFESLMLGWGTITFSYAGHSIFLRLRTYVGTQKVYKQGILLSFVFISLVYFPVSIVTYHVYGDSLLKLTEGDNILLVMDKDPWVLLSLTCVTIHVIIGYVIFMNLVFLFIEERMYKEYEKRKNLGSFWNGVYGRSLIRSGIVIATLIVALVVPFFGAVQSFIGSTSCTALSLILPSLFYLKLFWNELSMLSKVINIGVVLYGVFIGTVTTFYAIKLIVNDAIASEPPFS
eukprot:Nk52_evm12s242 gene=Nk52_evmTU12s242